MAGSRKNQRRRGRRRSDGSRNGRQERASRDANGEGSPAGPARGRGRPVTELCELSPLSAFCAVYLGISEDDGYLPAELPRVAKRFGVSEEELLDYLDEHDLGAECLRKSEFDLESARLDIQVAPEGVSRLELARTLLQEYEAARRG